MLDLVVVQSRDRTDSSINQHKDQRQPANNKHKFWMKARWLSRIRLIYRPSRFHCIRMPLYRNQANVSHRAGAMNEAMQGLTVACLLQLDANHSRHGTRHIRLPIIATYHLQHRTHSTGHILSGSIMHGGVPRLVGPTGSKGPSQPSQSAQNSKVIPSHPSKNQNQKDPPPGRCTLVSSNPRFVDFFTQATLGRPSQTCHHDYGW